MIKLGSDGNAVISCDVPGCGFSQMVGSENIAWGIRNGSAGTERQVRAEAEVRLGWFFEKLQSRRGALVRDVCPRQAAGYRTLLAARKVPG